MSKAVCGEFDRKTVGNQSPCILQTLVFSMELTY